MFENILNFFKNWNKKENKTTANSKDAAKERLHLVLMQDRANVSADFLELMKQEIIEVIKKYIDVDEKAIDVRLTNKENSDGTNGAPALYANIPILNIKNEARKMETHKKEEKKELEKDIQAEEKVEEAETIIEEVGGNKEEKAPKKSSSKEEKNSETEKNKQKEEQEENTETKTENESEEKQNVEENKDKKD